MKAEKAKEHYAKFHRTSIMIRENYEKKLGSSQDDKSPGTWDIHQAVRNVNVKYAETRDHFVYWK